MATTLYSLNQFFTTTLNVGGGIDNSQTSGIVISSVSGLDITKPGIALLSYTDPLVTANAEWITYTSINGSNELQGVARGQEGYSAKAHANGVAIAFPLSESHINKLVTALSIGGSATNGLEGFLDENDMASNSATKGATQRSIKTYVDATAGGPWTTYSAVTPTSGTLDDPTFELSFAGVDLSTTLYPGMRVRYTQGTVKYGIITKVAFSTNTTVTIYGGTDYDLVSTGTTAITAFAYSTHKAPAGFPLEPSKWTIETTNSSECLQNTPTQNTWYNLGTIAPAIHIGSWRITYSVYAEASKSTATNDIEVTLSTANNSESDEDFTTVAEGYDRFAVKLFNEKVLNLTSKTTYYLNGRTTTASSGFIDFRGDRVKTIIRQVCAYL